MISHLCILHLAEREVTMFVKDKAIIKQHISALYWQINNTKEDDKLLDELENISYDMLEYINQVRRRKMKDERRDKGSPFGRQGR